MHCTGLKKLQNREMLKNLTNVTKVIQTVSGFRTFLIRIAQAIESYQGREQIHLDQQTVCKTKNYKESSFESENGNNDILKQTKKVRLD